MLLVSHSSSQQAPSAEQSVGDDVSPAVPGCERKRAIGAPALLHAGERNIGALVVTLLLSASVRTPNACLSNDSRL